MFDRVAELKSLATRGDPWFFLCASSYIEYLARITYGKSTNQKDYKDFLKYYFFKACPKYDKFKFNTGQKDLDIQMYHVLRCGIVHSFSLIADNVAAGHGGRNRSILLAHRASGKQHLSNYINNRTTPKIDAAIFIAEDFADDIEEATKHIFKSSRKLKANGKNLRQNIKKWSSKHPPITGKFR